MAALFVVAGTGCPAGDDGSADTEVADGPGTSTPGESTNADPSATSTAGSMSTTADPSMTGPGDSTSTPGTDDGTSTGGDPATMPCQASGITYVPGLSRTDQGGAAPAARVPSDVQSDPDPFNGGGFIPAPDGGGNFIECDLWAQDCPAGEKCMPWANDGGASWNATRCSPLAPDPGAPGDACTVEGSGVSGIDDCELGAICFGVDGQTNMGTCVEMCSGSEAAPVCETPGTACVVTNGGVLILCQALCNPLATECPAGQGCYAVNGVTVCAPDASGDVGMAGDPCQFINSCDDGTLCAAPDTVPGCEDTGCCSPFCPIGDDSACLEGQSCAPLYPPGEAPLECVAEVGVCTVP